MSRRTTLRDVAKLAGVSHTTVSLALRNSLSISGEVRKQIQALAAKVGYQPDPLVVRVMSTLRFPKEGSRRLAYVVRYRDNSWKKTPTAGRTFQALLDRAAELGYEVDEFRLTDQGMTGRWLSSILFNRSIRGVFISSSSHSHSHTTMDFSKVSAITFGYSLVRPVLHRVANHQFHSLLLAMRKLRRFGNRRVGLAMLESIDARSDHNWSAAKAVFDSQIHASQRIPVLAMKNETFEEFEQWFTRNKPDAIAFISSLVPGWLKKLGVRVPEDVQIATLDRGRNDTSYAGIDQNHDVAGSAAVDLLLGQMYMNECGVPAIPRTVLIEGTWVDGPSAGKR